MEWVLGVAGILITILIAIWQWVLPELTRVQSAVRASEPRIDCTIGSYNGAGSGLHAQVHNGGQVVAHKLSLSVAPIGDIWNHERLDAGEWARPQIGLPQDSPVLSTQMIEPRATLTFEDRFGLQYLLIVELTQTRRDDGRFNVGSRPSGPAERPALTRRTLWRLRKEV